MKRVIKSTVTVLLMTSVCPSAGIGQSVREIESSPQCPGCRIRIEAQLIIEDTDGSGGLALPNTLTVDTQGRVFVVTNIAPSDIIVYGPDGRYERVIGAKGSGPGEFQRVTQILAHTQGIDVFDYSLNRWNELDEDFLLLRSTQLPGSPRRAIRWNDHIVINARIATRERAGYPIHIISRDGLLIDSYGYDSLTYRIDIPYSGSRYVAACPNGWLWWAGPMKYRVEGLSPTGERRSYVRRAEWFEPHLSRPQYTIEAGPPPPMLSGLACDSSNRLWTVTHVADPDWRSAGLRRSDVEYHGSDWENHFRPERYFDTIIEVLDMGDGRVIAAARSTRWLRYFTPSLHFATYDEKEVLPRLTVWSVRLITDSARK